MTKIEDICRAFATGAYPLHTWDGIPAQMQEMYRDGIRAVLEAHVKPYVTPEVYRQITGEADDAAAR